MIHFEEKMKMKILLIFLILNWIESFEVKKFCYKIKTNGKEFECNGDFSHDCGNNMCAKDENSCKLIALYYFFPSRLNEYMRRIKHCLKPTYNWKPNDVCSNSKSCFYSSVRIWPSGSSIQPECNCGGNNKYKYKCIKNYCGLDKRACEGLKTTKSIKLIKKCKLFLRRN